MASKRQIKDHLIMNLLIGTIIGGFVVALIKHGARQSGYHWVADNWG